MNVSEKIRSLFSVPSHLQHSALCIRSRCLGRLDSRVVGLPVSSAGSASVAMRALLSTVLLLLHQHASALLLPHTSTLRARAPRMDTQWSSPSYSSPASSGGSPSPAELCAALQNGEARVAGLDEVLSGTKTARPFFDAYLTGDEWTCADAEAPPRPLAASIANAPAPVLEALLFNVVTSAASETPDARRAAQQCLGSPSSWSGPRMCAAGAPAQTSPVRAR